jgi:hypothetical protein
MRDLLGSFPSRSEPKALDGVRLMMNRAQGTIAMTDTDTLERQHDDGTVIASISRSLANLETSLRGVSEAICREYFAPVPPARQLVEYQ